ncbi:MAG: hypothetical protein LBV74_01030 [Tannerella sp.]|jgi:hypothetical protein|nr:hypothetical protein [Tannerella sp.]
MANKTLPGIKSVEYCEASQAAIVCRGLYNSQTANVWNELKQLPIIGQGRMEISESAATGEVIYSSKITFNIPDCSESEAIKNEIISNDCCFVITDMIGNRKLIGMDRKPHPVVTVNYLNEETPAGKILYAVEITHTNNIPPVTITNL